MAGPGITRLNYYNRQFLGANDFMEEQQYHRDMRRRHNIGPHTWGIVAGLDLRQTDVAGSPGQVDVILDPGMAIDGFGREIVVLEPLTFTSELFAALTGVGFRSVFIGYDEELARTPRPGYEACDGEKFTRREEGYRLVIEAPSPTHDAPVVAGVEATKPEDLSIPYQEFPEDDDGARWLVPLGRVLWDGGLLQFRKATDADVARGRRYVSAVAEAILSPAGRLLLRGRHATSPLPAGDPGIVVHVEGAVQADRAIVAKDGIDLYGGKLDFRNANGTSPMGQFAIQRVDPGGAAGVDLQVKIGSESAGKNRLLIDSNGNRVTITDQGDVSVRGRTTLHGGYESRGDSIVANNKTLTLEGGPLEFKTPGAPAADWAMRVVNDNLQFFEPDDANRLAFEVLDTSSSETSPCVRLHGNAQATLSAQQLIDLTHGTVTNLHRHPLRISGNVQTLSLTVAANSSTLQTIFIPAPARQVLAAIFLSIVDPTGGFGANERVRARIVERDGVALAGTPSVYSGTASSLRFELATSGNVGASAVAVLIYDDV